MYTQCPECKVAFRITAEVLQQARGKVRCGSCGGAFNALDHLSESPPPRPGNAPSARQPGEEAGSRALMDTLNRLAGPENVRIEDTGIEWRVVDRDDVSDIGSGIDDAPDADRDIGESRDDNDMTHGEESRDDGQAETADAERRYDDNTPLPEDFFDDNPEPPPYETPRRRATDFEFVGTDTDNDAQAELELSEPEDWTDLLDEFADAETEAGETEEHDDAVLQGAESSAESADDAGIPELDEASESAASGDDEDDFYDSELSLVADENGDIGIVSEDAGDIDLSGIDADLDEAPLGVEAGHDDTDPDASASLHVDDDDLDSDEYAWDDELGDDLDESIPDDGVESSGEPDEFEGDRPGADIDVTEIDEEDVDEYEIETAPDESLDDAEEERLLTDGDADPGTDEPVSEDTGARRDGRNTGDAFEASDGDEADGSETAIGADEEPDDFAAMTANMQIDPAVLKAMRDGNFDGTMTGEDGSPLVETIIMEGDFVADSLDDATDNRLALEDTDPESLLDTYITSRASDKKGLGGRVYTAIGIGVLLLGLAAQYVHSQRDYLATFDLFNKTIGPIYRSVGMPVTPDWDIKGWQFEATSGSTGEDEEILTITSRISNRSAQALPYPLVHVSLTDRYEEIIGSRMMKPADYLRAGADPREAVAPGENFTATITISSTSAEATGFKLNVCYREAGNRVRCAIEDFKKP